MPKRKPDRCEFIDYDAKKYPKWPHFRRCRNDSEETIYADGMTTKYCAEHFAVWEKEKKMSERKYPTIPGDCDICYVRTNDLELHLFWHREQAENIGEIVKALGQMGEVSKIDGEIFSELIKKVSKK